MNPIDLVTDPYDRQARLYPALLLVSPALVALALLAAPRITLSNSLLATFASFGGLFFLSQLARGRTKESSLFTKWGGMPSIVIMRHSDTRVDSYTKERYHKALASLVSGTTAPTVHTETNSPNSADGIYQAWSTYLRVNTRDTKSFPLVFKENVNYGYRRNLWAMKALGILISASVVGGCVAMAVVASRKSIPLDLGYVWTGSFAAIMLLLWIFRFTPAWVKAAADAYAERLLESVDLLATKMQRKRAATKKPK